MQPLLSHNHLRQPSTDMDIRESFSRLKKKLKHPGTGRRSDRARADPGRETVDPASSLSRQLPHVVEGDDYHQEDRTYMERQRIRTTGAPPPPDVLQPAPARGNVHKEGGGEGPGVGRGEAGQKYLHPHSDIGVVMESGPGREGGGADGEKDRKSVV